MSSWKPMVQDGMKMSDGKGGMYRVFNPPRWRLDLWAGWYAARAQARLAIVARRLGIPVKFPELMASGHVTITFHDAKSRPVPVQLRVERVKVDRYNVIASSLRKL